MKYISLLLAALILAGCAPAATPQPSAPAEAQVESSESLESSSQTSEVVLPVVQAGEGSNVQIIGGDEASLREFVQRWLAPVYPGGPGGTTTVQIGALPEDMPLEVPIPEGARVVGSVQQPESYTQIILDADLSPAEITAFYTERLGRAGWQPAPQEPQGGGFVSPGGFPARYCRQDADGYLEMWILEDAGKPADVRLNLYGSMAGSFCQAGGAGSMGQGMDLMPALVAPAGTNMLGGGSGGSGDGSAYISSDLETGLSAEELLEHYNAQLVSAGWELLDQGSTPVAAWSTWKLTDERGDAWGGTLFIMEGSLNAEKRFAMLSVERAP